MFFWAAFIVLLIAGVHLERYDWLRVLDFVVVVGVVLFICWLLNEPIVFYSVLVLIDAVLVLIVIGADINLPPGAGRFIN